MNRLCTFERAMMGSGAKLRIHAVIGSRGAMLVDTAMRGYESLVKEAVTSVGRLGRDVTWIVNTHAHHDHMGLNSFAQKLTGARIAAHVHGRAWIRDPLINYREFVLQFPDLIKDTPATREEVFNTLGEGTELDMGIKGGEHFYLGDTDVEVVSLPGHVLGEVGLLVREDHTLILGDVLIGLDLPMFHGYVHPVAYRQSLQRLRELVASGAVRHVVTSHLPAIEGSQGIIGMVDERLCEVSSIESLILEMLNRGPTSVEDIWLFVSQAKHKRAEFRGLAMVQGHLEDLTAQMRIVREHGRYCLA